MTDDTQEAPERIFITGNATAGSWNSAPVTFRGPVETEYIRIDVAKAMAARAIAADRIEELEAKLAKAVEWVKNVREYAISWDDKYLAERSNEIIAELTGGKDE